VGSLHERAGAGRLSRRRRTPLVVGAAAVVLVAAVAAGVVALLHDSNIRTVGPARSSATPAPAALTFGRVRVALPAGWQVAAQTDTRVDLTPDDGARQRITIVQQSLAPGASLDDVADTLAAEITSHHDATGLRRNTVVGGRTGVAYEEHPTDGTTVHWQVLVAPALQVSIGCQSLPIAWQTLTPACETVIGDLRVTS
jgi:type VII secretion-associated protein (TIGR03931 family)